MKNFKILGIFFISHLISNVALATPGTDRLGLGIILGSPTALTGKLWLSDKNAVDIGISFGSYYSALVYGDYFWHFPNGFGRKNKFLSQLTPYIGAGVGFYSWSGGHFRNRPGIWGDHDGGTSIYARLPLGAEWYPTDPPIGVFAEITPGIAIIPGTWMTIDIGVGARYYF